MSEPAQYPIYQKVRLWSYSDAAFWSIMVGCGESFVVAFALACGFGEKLSGVLSIVPLGIASILQLYVLQLLPAVGSRKYYVALSASFQAFAVAGLALSAYFGVFHPVLIFVLVTGYWVFGFSAGPPWNAWIVSLMPKSKLAPFFSHRGIVHELALLSALMAGGIWLHEEGGTLWAFAMLFATASFARLVSVFCLLQTPPEGGVVNFSAAYEFDALLRWFRNPKVVNFVVPLSLFQLGVGIGAPFYAPYLLKQKELSYYAFSAMISLPIVARAASYVMHAKATRRFGLRRCILVNGVMIAVIPMLWALHPPLIVLAFMQIVAGMAWAGYEYGVVMMQIEDFPSHERSRILAWSNLITGSANIVGVIIGSILMTDNPSLSSYSKVFASSGFTRLLPLVALAFLLPEGGRIVKRIFVRILGTQVGRGGLTRPVLYVEDEVTGETERKEEKQS